MSSPLKCINLNTFNGDALVQKKNLRDHIISALDKYDLADPVLTVGLEQEVFLLNKNGTPCTHEQSQKVLEEISKKNNWYVREEEDSVLGSMITRVSMENGRGRFTVVKYDHHPHLLEVAFGYCDNLHDLSDLVKKVYQDIASVVNECEVVLSKECLLDYDLSSPNVTSKLNEFVELRNYRKLLLEGRFHEPKLSQYANYAAGIAATQVHVGGLKWWKNSEIISQLYTLEAVIKCAIAKYINPKNSQHMLEQRWAGYKAVFDKFNLIGYPHITEWDLNSWVSELLKSPLAGPVAATWSGKTYLSLDASPFINWNQFMKAVRDLQIIRPKLYGTLEFRADPAMNTPESMVALAALRLGLCEAVRSGLFTTKDKEQFREVHDAWWSNIAKGPYSWSELLQHAYCGLKSRNFGEEAYLIPLQKVVI